VNFTRDTWDIWAFFAVSLLLLIALKWDIRKAFGEGYIAEDPRLPDGIIP
jgi:hypothetical protein